MALCTGDRLAIGSNAVQTINAGYLDYSVILRLLLLYITHRSIPFRSFPPPTAVPAVSHTHWQPAKTATGDEPGCLQPAAHQNDAGNTQLEKTGVV